MAWHAAYADLSSSLSIRLRRVQSHLAQALDRAPPGLVRVVSLCAGQGNDVLGVLPRHPRRADVRAVLVELDPGNAAKARQAAAELALSTVEVRHADASRVASFADALPAHVLLLCGIFGNVSEHDIQRTVCAVPALCAAGARVIWTRHRRPPDLTPQVREWFTRAGCAEVAFDKPGNATLTGVGVCEYLGAPAAALPTEPLFTFRPA